MSFSVFPMSPTPPLSTSFCFSIIFFLLLEFPLSLHFYANPKRRWFFFHIRWASLFHWMEHMLDLSQFIFWLLMIDCNFLSLNLLNKPVSVYDPTSWPRHLSGNITYFNEHPSVAKILSRMGTTVSNEILNRSWSQLFRPYVPTRLISICSNTKLFLNGLVRAL